MRAYQAKGDPFLGGLIAFGAKALAPTVGKFVGKVLGKKAGPKVIGAIAGAGGIAGKIMKSKAGRVIGSGVAMGAGYEVGSRAVRGAAMVGGGGGGFGKRRRINVTNPKALRRAMSRVQGFAKMASKTISFTKRVKMKKRGRR